MATELYIKFKETHSEEDFNKLNTYIQELHKIGEDLYENDDIEFTDEEYDKLCKREEELEQLVFQLFFGDLMMLFVSEYNLDGYDSWDDTLSYFFEDLWDSYSQSNEA